MDIRIDHTSSVSDRLLDAAVTEFALNGFDGASTRRIAENAGSHQPQVNYFFGSKDGLWRAAFEDLYARLAIEMSVFDFDGDPGTTLSGVIRTFVRFTHRNPRLHRMLFHEFAAASSRLDWAVERFTRSGFDDFHRLWADATAAGIAAPIDRRVVFHLFVGAATLLPVAAAEASQHLGVDIDTEQGLVAAHADGVVMMLLPGLRPPTPDSQNRPVT